MKLRVARHTGNLSALINFYVDVLGLNILGEFKDHDGYDGVFVGLPGADWHLEFTISTELPVHTPDDDDLLVFYPENVADYERLISRLMAADIKPVEPKNPYWKANGIIYTDPDGYRLVLVIPKSI